MKGRGVLVDNHFVMRRPKFRIVIFILTALIFIISSVIYFHGHSNPRTDWGFWSIIATISAAIALIFMAIYDIVWKCTVFNDDIHVRTLFRRRSFTFSDVRWVKLSERYIVRGYHSMAYVGFYLTSKDKTRLLYVPVRTRNYSDFVHTLKMHEIGGAEKIPD